MSKVIKIREKEFDTAVEALTSEYSEVKIAYNDGDLIVSRIVTPIIGQGAVIIHNEGKGFRTARPATHSVMQCSFFAMHNGSALLCMDYLSPCNFEEKERQLKKDLIKSIRSEWGLMKGVSAK